MYDFSSVVIAAILFATMAIAIEFGYRLGARGAATSKEAARTQIGAIQASLLGVLALMLGFTFSLALQRFDSRSDGVVEEANAIGTAWLRTELLPQTVRGEARQLLSDYLALRVEAATVDLAHEAERQALLDRSVRLLDTIWALTARVAVSDSNPATTALFVNSVNTMIDAFGKRDAQLARHVPELVLFLLFGTFIMTGSIVGYSAGVGGHRASFATYIMVALIVLLVFIIIDLDRPRRGLVQVSQKSLTDLNAHVALRTAPDPRNAAYIISGQEVRLVDGRSERPAAPGSASRVVTRHWGDEVVADLDGDGRQDAIVFLMQETGGSGAFSYVAAALNRPEGAVGTHAVLIGDRVSPQSIEVTAPMTLEVRFADRLPGESLATPPSRASSLRLRFDPVALEFGELAEMEGEADPDVMTLGMKPWIWVGATQGGTDAGPRTEGAFTLTFGSDGRLTIGTDCNRHAGAFTVDKHTLAIDDIAGTQMYCEGSQEQEFLELLGRTANHRFTSRGELVLTSSDEGTVLRFR